MAEKVTRQRDARGRFLPREGVATAPAAIAPAETIARGPGGVAQVRKRGGRLSEEAKATFLQTLAETCNITRAAEAAGHCRQVFVDQRKRCPVFAAAWAAALAKAYEHVEMMMLERTITGLAALAAAPERATGPSATMRRYTDEQAMRLLRLHRQAATGGRGGEAAADEGKARAEQYAADRAALDAKLDLMRLRLMGEDAGAAAGA